MTFWTTWLNEDLFFSLFCRSSVRLAIRKIQYAPDTGGPAPSGETTCEFVMSDKPLHMRVSLEKEVKFSCANVRNSYSSVWFVSSFTRQALTVLVLLKLMVSILNRCPTLKFERLNILRSQAACSTDVNGHLCLYFSERFGIFVGKQSHYWAQTEEVRCTEPLSSLRLKNCN